MYQLVNSEQDGSQEEVPVCIGGKTSVLKQNLLNDLNLAAEYVFILPKLGNCILVRCQH